VRLETLTHALLLRLDSFVVQQLRDQRLGRRLTAREVHELLKNTGKAEYVELDYGRQEQKEP
jgi:hypothetical protein